MTKFKAWVSAARLRTLPLSVSGIIVGSVLGHKWVLETGSTKFTALNYAFGSTEFYFSYIFLLAIATTLGLQVLSNFANDYGDGVKGTDNADRVGPQRAIQSGAISRKSMFRGIILTAILTLIAAIVLIYKAFGHAYFGFSVFFFLLGIAAIAAAIKYTMGKKAYGYKGLGDIFVFFFFGIVSVVGCYFLFTKQLNGLIIFPAIAVGTLSVSVLNLNNLRDHKNDKNVGKNTLVVQLGFENAKKYHYLLVVLAMLSIALFLIFSYESPKNLLILIVYAPLLIHLIKTI